jgi:hypothetical protein
MRLIYTAYGIESFANVYWDREWREFIVKLFISGKHKPQANYFTTDNDDAVCTANMMIANMEGKK